MENIKRPVNIKNPEIDILLRAIPWVWERGDELAGANNNTCWGIRDAHRANLLKHAVEINPADSSELKTALEAIYWEALQRNYYLDYDLKNPPSVLRLKPSSS